MWKLIAVTFVLGAFAVTGLSSEADAQYRGCSKAPKNAIPCTVHRDLPAKPQGRY